MEQAQKEGQLQGLMVFMASLSHGLEKVLGRGAKSVVFRAGRNVGMKVKVQQQSDDPLKALELVQDELRRKGVAWEVTPYKPASSRDYVYDKDGKNAMKVVCRNCMIRCALFRYSHEQQQSLCMMNQGEFCGIFKKITGKNAMLEIIHPGENACLKELIWDK